MSKIGNLNLITGTAAHYYFFKEKILKHYNSGNSDSYIYLLPVNRAARYFKQHLFSAVGEKGIVDPQVFTFNSLIQKIFKELSPSTKIINKTMRVLFLQDVLFSLKTDLNITKNNVQLSRSLIRKIDLVLNELKEFGYETDSKNKSELEQILKISDFDLIINKLNEFYNKNQFSFIDESSLLAKTVNELDYDIFKKLFPNVRNIYINGYGIYTPPMLEFISKIKLWCSVEILLEFNSENKDLFQNTRNAFESLQNIADSTESQKNNLNDLEKRLFKYQAGFNDKINLSEKITIRQAQNSEQELCLIASSIKELYFKHGVPLHRIGVTFPNLEKYFNTIKSVFNEYEIPINISTGFPLQKSHLIKSYLQVLKIIISGFSLNEIFKLFLSPYYNSGEAVDFGSFKKIAIQLRLTHLRGNGIQIINNFKRQDKSFYNSGISDESLQSFKDELNRLMENLASLNNSLNIHDFYNNYLESLKKLGMFVGENVKTDALEIKESENEFRAFNKFILLFKQLKWTLEINHGDRKFSTKEYFNLINLIIEEPTYNLREWPNYGVQIMPRLEIQSVEPQYLFVGGLIEGDFPRKFTRDIFFNDEERALLGLNASEDLLSQDRFLFFQLITSNAKKIVLSYPQFQGESMLVPSSFLSNLERVCSVEKLYPPSAEMYFSKNKIIECVSEKLHSGVDKDDINYFNMWSQKVSAAKKDILLEDLTTLFAKRSRKNITKFEGNLTENQAGLNLLNEYYQNKSFSITALETYAFCPMQYFMQRILKLKEEKEIETTIPALERGFLIHKILFKFFIRLKSNKLHTQPWNYFELLNEIADEEFQNLKYEGLLWELEKEIYFGNESQPGLWKKFLEVEIKEFNQSGFKPAFFEVEFGLLNRKNEADFKGIPFVIEIENGQIQLFGKIDRIDIDNNHNAIIYDYKTGRSGFNIRFNDIFEGKSLQLPVYLAAANKIFNSLKLNITTIAGGYYLVMNSDNCERKTLFVDIKKKPDIKVSGGGVKLPNVSLLESSGKFGIDELIDRTKFFISEYINNLYQGNFQHTTNPTDIKCSKYCAYRMICRKDISKLGYLNQQENNANE